MSESSNLDRVLMGDALMLVEESDFVVGSYNVAGTPIQSGKVVGGQSAIDKFRKSTAQNAAAMGGRPAPKSTPAAPKAKRGRKKKVETTASPPYIDSIGALMDYHSSTPTPDEANNSAPELEVFKQKLTVYLYNKLGKIKLSVERVLTTDMAICLVFRNDDDMIFIPNPTETLTFIDELGVEHKVYYPDTIFTWLDNTKKLMILFKTNDESTESEYNESSGNR